MWFTTTNVPEQKDDWYGDENSVFKVPRFASAESFSNPTDYVRQFSAPSPELSTVKQTLSVSQNLWFKLFENGRVVDFAILKSEIDKQPNFDQKLAKIKQMLDAMVGEIEIYLKNYTIIANNKSSAWREIYKSMVIILLQLNLYTNKIGQQMQAQWISESQVSQKIVPYMQESFKMFNGYNTIFAFIEAIEKPLSIDDKLKEMESIHKKFKDYAAAKNDYLQWLIRQFNSTNDVNQKKQILAEFRKFIDGDIKTYYYESLKVYSDYWPHFQPAKVDEFSANFEFSENGKKNFIGLITKWYNIATSLMQNAKDIYDDVIGAHNQMYYKLYPEQEQS